MSRKIRQSLEAITLGVLDNLLSEIHRAKEGLTRLEEDVVELQVFKEVLPSNPLQPLNGSARTDPEPPHRSLYTMSEPA